MSHADLKEQDMALAREAIQAINARRRRQRRRHLERLGADELRIIAQAIADAREEGWRARVDRIGPPPPRGAA